MIQSGILTTVDSTTGQSTGVPVRGAWINFVQNNVTKATVQTNMETGAYSTDVPLGKYTVKIAVGDVTGIQRAGQLFELKTGDKADAFHKWFYSETGSIDDDLLKQFKQVSNDINASANRAESAEKGAKQIETNMQNNSIGNTNGKWMKEGAYGIGLTRTEHVTFPVSTPNNDRIKNLMARANGVYRMIGGVGGATAAQNPAVLVMHSSDMDEEISSLFAVDMYRNRLSIAFCSGTGKPIVQGDLYTTLNTAVDTNGFIKKASPIIKLFDDHIEWNQDFKEDPIFEKIAPGTYKISNTYGLSRECWTYEKPRGKDGNLYFKIKVQKLDDGCIVSVHDYFIDYEDVTIIDDAGNKRTVKKQIEVLSQARDIKPEERWIDLRFFEKIYDLTNESPKVNIPYHPLWGIEPYIPPVVEQIEDMALLDQRAF